MADLIFQNCCDVPVEGKFEGEGAVCPGSERHGKAILVSLYHGECIVSDLESAGRTAKTWNYNVSDPTRIVGFDIPERS